MAAVVAAIHKRDKKRARRVVETDEFEDKLPPLPEQRRSGHMEKKMVTSSAQAKPGSDGVAWLPRFAVVCSRRLSFVKDEGDEDVIDFIPLAEMTAVDLHSVDVEIISQKTDKTEHEVHTEHHLTIQTVADGFNSGRRYVLKTSEADAQGWLLILRELVEKAKRRVLDMEMQLEHGGRGLAYYRARSRNFYESPQTQYVVAVLIMFAFAVDIGEAQVMPSEESIFSTAFFLTELALTAVFTLELVVNMLSKSNDFFKPFWSHPMNLFDALVVAISIASLLTKMAGVEGIPNIKIFRLVRVFRVVRLFKRFKSLNKIIKAISTSLLPVANSLFILLIFTAIYAVLATHLFRDRSSEFFGNFSASFFTMIQVVSGDSWASAVSRSIFEHKGEMDSEVAAFFTSYFLIAAVTLLNVVVAVLLDEFVTAVQAEKDADAEEQRRQTALEKNRGVLDPVTHSLIEYEDDEDLNARIDRQYMKLNSDFSDGLTFQEFRSGLKKLDIHLTQDDWDILTDHGRLTDDNDMFDMLQFRDIMKVCVCVCVCVCVWCVYVCVCVCMCGRV